MTSPTLRTLSLAAGTAAVIGAGLCAYALATDSSAAGAAALTLIAVVLFFVLRHLANRNVS